ncbi:MAG: T9SS type A sorting domain-containing protein [Saprospiraceae bacterium]
MEARLEGLKVFSYQTVRDTTWGFAKDTGNNELVIFSPSTSARVAIPSVSHNIEDVVANTNGDFILRGNDTLGSLSFGELWKSNLEAVPFYRSNMLEIIGFSNTTANGSRIVFGMGAEEVDRYFIQGGQFCPSVIRATFFINFTAVNLIYQPKRFPSIQEITITDDVRNFSMSPLGDSIFTVSVDAALKFNTFNNETVGLRWAVGDTSQSILRFRRGCHYATLANTNDLPISGYYSGNTSTATLALMAWHLSVDGWPAEPFGIPFREELNSFSSTKEIFTEVIAYPNPTSNHCSIQLNESAAHLYTWTIIATDGRRRTIFPTSVSNQIIAFTFSDFPAGAYQLIGYSKKGNIRTSLVIK